MIMVTSMPSSTSEKQLSRQLCYKYLNDEYTVVREFSVKVGDRLVNRIDVAAVKWLEDGFLEAIAIECKRGNSWFEVGSALNQALAYKTIFPKVYIAAETTERDLGHLREVLQALGLGYIQVKVDDEKTPIEVLSPSSEGPNLFDESMFNEIVVHRLGRYAAYESYWGRKETRCGPGEERKSFFISGRERKHLNYLCHFVEPNSGYDTSFTDDASFIEIGINLESTPSIRTIFKKVPERDFLDVLKKLPHDAVLKAHPFQLMGETRRKMPYSKIKINRPIIDITRIDELGMKDVKRLYSESEKMRYHIWFAVVNRILLENLKISRSAYLNEVKALESDYRPFYDFVAENVFPKGLPKEGKMVDACA